MSTRTVFQAFAAAATTAMILGAVLVTGASHAYPVKVEQLPRVVVAGKSLGSPVAQLPRVVVEGRSLILQAAAQPAGSI